MSRPPLKAEKTVAGIAVDPQTLERVIPESKRPDGTVRKQIKIRPGFTPQEDVRRFRGTRQAQMDATTLPKGHIIGWTPPPQPTAESVKPMSKSAKKNAKRREKKQEKTAVPDDWEDEEEEGGTKASTADKQIDETRPPEGTKAASTASPTSSDTTALETLSSKLDKLQVN